MTDIATTIEFDLQVSRPGWEGRFQASLHARSVGVLGPSGGGKSTLIRVLAGVESAAGSLVVNGAQWLGPDVFVRPADRGVGWAPQGATLFPHMTVEANILAGAADDADLHELTRVLGIHSLLGRRPRHLSGGERSRVALARALLSARGMLLLDEPFASLNDGLAHSVAEYIVGFIADTGMMLIVADHREDLVRKTSEVSLHLEDGQLSNYNSAPIRESP